MVTPGSLFAIYGCAGWGGRSVGGILLWVFLLAIRVSVWDEARQNSAWVAISM